MPRDVDGYSAFAFFNQNFDWTVHSFFQRGWRVVPTSCKAEGGVQRLCDWELLGVKEKKCHFSIICLIKCSVTLQLLATCTVTLHSFHVQKEINVPPCFYFYEQFRNTELLPFSFSTTPQEKREKFIFIVFWGRRRIRPEDNLKYHIYLLPDVFVLYGIELDSDLFLSLW